MIRFGWLAGVCSFFGLVLTLWALAVRVVLRMGLLLPEAPRTVLLALPEELDTVLRSWKRVSHRQCLHPVDANGLAQQLFHLQQPVLVALSQGVCQDPALRPLLASLEMHDPRQVRVLSVLSLFEQQQERLPPVLLADTVFGFDDLPWVSPFSVQAQLKLALFVAAALLLISAPFVLLAALLIWIETVVQCFMPSSAVAG